MAIFKLRKSFQNAIKTYEKHFGHKDHNYKYFVRSSNQGAGIVVMVCYVTESGVVVIKSQALIVGGKVYKNNKLVVAGGSDED